MNAYGDVDDGASPATLEAVTELAAPFDYTSSRTETTLGVVLTNARLDKTGCHLVAQGGHDGLARALTPPHTRFDGDAFIAAATGHVDANVDTVRLMAVLAVTDAIRSAAAPHLPTTSAPEAADQRARDSQPPKLRHPQP